VRHWPDAHALAQKYPSDRFGYMLFEDDPIFSGFSYHDFYPCIQQEPDPGSGPS